MNVLFKILIDALLGLLFAIDNVVYSFIPKLYRLLLYLANVDLVTNNIPVQALIQRIYILVGVFMLFRLSFSIMNYIINPDAFGDQAKGFTNLVKRVLIAIVLLVGIPWFFTEAYVVQNKILTSGILPRLVLGQSMDEYSDNNGNDKLEETIETSAKDVQFLLFGPFFSLNYASKGGELEACSPSATNPTSNILGTSGMASNEACMRKFAELMDNSKDIAASGAFLSDYFRYSENGVLQEDTRQFESFGSLITLTLENGDRAINYLFIASTLCGGYLVFLLLSFCIDVAARVIRLLLLQILSPIAVISSIDPTSSGDRLKEWARECVKVWASLFLRLLVVFLIIQLVRVISNSVFDSSLLSTNYSNSHNLSAWIYIFLVLGVFQAAKSVPDLIEKATGIKLSGELQLNPFKALKENAGVGLGIAGVNKGLGFATGLGMGVIGAATGAGAGRILAGAYQGLKSKNALEVQKSMVEGNRRLRNARSDGSTLRGRAEAWVTNLIGSQGALGKIEDDKVREENEIHRLENIKAGLTNDKNDIENNIRGVREEITQRQAVGTAIGKIKGRAYTKVTQGEQYLNAMASVEALRARADNSTNETERLNLLKEARKLEGETERMAHNEWSQDWLANDGRDDAIAYSAMQEYQTAADQARLESYDYSDAKSLWNQEDDITRGVARATSLISGQEQEIRNIDDHIRTVDQGIQTHQNNIRAIDERHRHVQSNYTAVGGQSGGTKEQNATNRTYAGQHPGQGGTPTFGPGYGPGSWGGGPGGPGHRP